MRFNSVYPITAKAIKQKNNIKTSALLHGSKRSFSPGSFIKATSCSLRGFSKKNL